MLEVKEAVETLRGRGPKDLTELVLTGGASILVNADIALDMDEKTEKPIVVDMLKTPHLLITGLSGQGKSRMIKSMLLNIRNADIIICNAYKDDYKSVRGRFINGEENIKVYLIF